MDQIVQLFGECWLFRNLERREKDALFTRVKIRDFAAGETIFVVGSPGDSGMILLDGTSELARGRFSTQFTAERRARRARTALASGRRPLVARGALV
jgi:hypothetical protein